MQLPITEAGVYDLPESVYHANPCPTFSFSRSFLADIIKTSPLHAKHRSSELSEDDNDDDATKAATIGKAMHAIALGKGADIEIIDEKSYQKKAAKEAKKTAIESGKIPLLVKQYKQVAEAMGALEKFTAGKYLQGKKEQAYIWQESGVWCRAMLDNVTEDGWIEDYKTTMGSAEPGKWIRNHLFPDLLDMQAAWYIRAYEEVLKTHAHGFRFVVQEQKAPYAVSIVCCDLSVLQLGMERIEHAFKIAKGCMGSGDWYGYEKAEAWATPTAYMLNDWEAVKARGL